MPVQRDNSTVAASNASQGKSGASSIIKTIRLPDHEVEQLLAKLEAAPKPEGAKNRKSARFRLRMRNCVASFQVGGGATASHFAVTPFDISETGMGFLHGGFVYPGARCAIRLITLHGSWALVPAVVKNCRVLQGAVHAIGVAFDHKVNPGEYCAEAVAMRLLVVDDSKLVLKLIQTFLSTRNAQIDEAVNGREAIKLAVANAYDAVFMDVEMPEMGGIEAITELRKDGYVGTVVAMSAKSSPADVEACLAAGFDKFLTKPCGRDEFLGMLESLRTEPLTSTKINDASMAELITEFVKSLPDQCRILEKAVVAKDADGVARACRNLKGSGGAYGFDPISEAAAKVEQLAAGGDFAAMQKAASDLLRLCLSARV